MTLNKVVLPAPLGPIRAVIVPALTPRLAPSTARIPPNRFTTSRTSSSGRPFPFPPVGAATTGLVSLSKDHLLPFAEQPLRTKRHQEDEHDSHEHETSRRNVFGAERQLDEPRALEDRP